MNHPSQQADRDELALPSRLSALWFQARSTGLKLHRAVVGPRARRLLKSEIDPYGEIAAESRTVLYPSAQKAEFALQAGKVQNLRVAARALNGVVVPAGRGL